MTIKSKPKISSVSNSEKTIVTKRKDDTLYLLLMSYGSVGSHKPMTIWVESKKGTYTIGRSPDIPIPLPEKSISRIHAEIRFIKEKR